MNVIGPKSRSNKIMNLSQSHHHPLPVLCHFLSSSSSTAFSSINGYSGVHLTWGNPHQTPLQMTIFKDPKKSQPPFRTVPMSNRNNSIILNDPTLCKSKQMNQLDHISSTHTSIIVPFHALLEFIQILHLLYTLMSSMASPKSSAGSKGVTGCKDSREALQSSWIRRLHLRPKSHPPPPPPPTSPTPPTPPVNNSPSTTDSGYAMIGGHLTDTSSHESRTPNPMLDASTTLFLHRLLKLRKEKPPLRADPESFSVSGFGPFQVQTRRRVSSTDVHNHNEVVKDDSVAGMNDGLNFNYSRNSSCFPTMQTMTQFVVEDEEEEEKIEKNSSLQQKWLPRNHHHTTLFTEKILFSSENHNSSSTTRKPQEMLINVEKRKLSDEQHNNTHSPFLQYWSSLKKLVYTKANPVTTLPRNGCLFDPSGEEEADNKFNNTNIDSCNLNHSLSVGGENKCSSSSRLPIRHFSASLRPMTKASHEISYFSRSGGITTYHESCHDGVAGRSYQGSLPTTQISAPHQHERRTPACSNETDDPSSFWNMNSFQRAEMVSSIFRACRTGNKKRNGNADVFLSMKSRKLDPEG